jgi:predicted SAM-dependent methyltransferase
MDGEGNYFNHDILQPFPFESGSVDGIFASHILEHFVLMDALDLVDECYRLLRPGGVLRVSVPCPRKFYEGTLAGKTDWGEPFHLNRGKTTTMLNYALFFHDHKQCLGKHALLCMLLDAGFSEQEEKAFTHTWLPGLADIDNRPEFSLFVEGRK